MTKLFTKSAFKVALSCPWKLYYYRNPEEYANANQNDEFLESLAEGGFQVGELAKYYCHVDEGADLKDVLGYDASLKRTAELMTRENVTIAEAAFRNGDLFVRVDVLRKRGNQIDLIEVKAKSWNQATDSFVGKSPAGSVKSSIRDYVYDVAFQKYVVQNALGEGYQIKAFLMMADKSKQSDIKGLNQLFKIRKNALGRAEAVAVKGYQDVLKESKEEVLTAFDVDELCDKIIAGQTTEQGPNNAKAKKEWMQGLLFKDFVAKASDAYCKNKRYPSTPALCDTCFKCEFRGCGSDGSLKDGKAECWSIVPDYGRKPMIESLNGSYVRRGDWVRAGNYFLDEVTDLQLKHSTGKSHDGLDHCQRKWLQIALETGDLTKVDHLGALKKNIKGNTYLDIDGLRKEMEKWVYPLHMIDFETTAVALPYYEGMRPYEQVAFQFSHHVIYEDGRIEHKGQYLNENVTEFPNFDFVLELKEQLKDDEGSIFRYSNHENTILREIARQAAASTLSDSEKTEIIEFILSITHNSNPGKGDVYKGPRDMIDLLEVVKKYFYNFDEMHGSNSIKQVLPAVLNCSQELKDKYSKPIYGKEIESCNFTKDDPKAWIVIDENGHVESPYHLLESVGELIGFSEEEMEYMEMAGSDDGDFEVANGGAALTAYNKLMFCEDAAMNDGLRQALLRYCELDTMSMVFIWEYFRNEINR